MLASSGGSWPLEDAAFLALSGGDPRKARPQPPGPEWDDRARELLEMLLDGRAADVHAGMTATFQGLVSPGQIDQGWRELTRDLGPAAEVQVTCRRWPAASIVADVTVTFASGTRAGRIHFNPSGQIAGLRFLPPQQDAPAVPSQAPVGNP
jgi:hypothetical protein